MDRMAMYFRSQFLSIIAGLCILGFGRPVAANLTYTFFSSEQVPVSGSGYVVSGSLNLSVDFAPSPGTNLTVINNTGLSFISGTFDGIPQGGIVPITYKGITYNYVANYYGGNGRSLVLQWPYTGLAAWGNGNTSSSSIPTAVNINGVLNGKTVVAIASGGSHTLVLTSDGKVFSWGNNDFGELGDDSTTYRSVPVAVNMNGALKGKTVVAIAAGKNFSLALTSDGKIFGWGDNGSGQLGYGAENTTEPVNISGLGYVVRIVAIAAGDNHCLALDSDGKVYSWGDNSNSQLGRYTSSRLDSIPTLITSCSTSGVLYGKLVTAIAAGPCHSAALTSDGDVYSWGSNDAGQLGNASAPIKTTNAVILDKSGALKGKNVVAIAAGGNPSYVYTTTGGLTLALTSDGQVYSWGFNRYGQLGNNSLSNSSVPVAVISTGVLAGKTVAAISCGRGHCLAMSSDHQIFTWGLNDAGQLGNNSTSDSSSVPVAVNTDGELSPNASEVIKAGGASYAIFGMGAPFVTVNPSSQIATTGTTVNFTAAANYKPTSSVKWQVSTTGTAGSFSDISNNATATTGTLSLTSVTQAQSGYAYRAVFTNNLGVSVTSPAILKVDACFNSQTDVPMVADKVSVSGSISIALVFTPSPGANLTLIRNTGTEFISGTFSNMPQGGTVQLSFGGVTYKYIANYFGENGRSLVLQWPYTKVAAWGYENLNISSPVPTAMAMNGALNGKTVVSVVSRNQSLALTLDGGIYKLGSVPTLIDTGTAMAGKMVVSVAVGTYHCLALTSDGLVFAWGENSYGELGNNTTSDSTAPVAVTGALFGKKVTAVAAGYGHSLALTSDGQVFAWGANFSGQLGNNSITNSSLPVAVSSISGKTVTAIAAGCYHSLALTSDCEIFAWGDNDYGQLGNNSKTSSSIPVMVNSSGVLAGKTVTSIATGDSHSMALTADGQVFSWGCNNLGQLGNNSEVSSSIPVTVSAPWATSGKVAGAIAGGCNHSLACTSDGHVYAWGFGMYGQLGNNQRDDSAVPVAVATGGSSALNSAPSIIRAGNNDSFAIFGWVPTAPFVVTHPISQTGTYGSTVSFTAAATSDLSSSIQWQVSSTGVNGTYVDITDNPSALTNTLNILANHSEYAYRAVFKSDVGTAISSPATLTVLRTFESFKTQYKLEGSAPAEDPYSTGVSNLAAYAFGVTPSAPERSQLPSATIQNNYLQISYPRWKDAADLEYTVEVSSDLQTWKSGVNYTQQISVTPIDSTRERVIERDLVPMDGTPHRFIRIRITN